MHVSQMGDKKPLEKTSIRKPMTREEWFTKKWNYLRKFGPVAIVGLVATIIGIATDHRWPILIGVIAILPWFFWVVMIPIYHWKDRYVGERTNLWGALLVLETSGWMK